MENHPTTEPYYSPIPDAVDILVHRLLYHFEDPPITDDEPMGSFGVNQTGWLPSELMQDESSLSSSSNDNRNDHSKM